MKAAPSAHTPRANGRGLRWMCRHVFQCCLQASHPQLLHHAPVSALGPPYYIPVPAPTWRAKLPHASAPATVPDPYPLRRPPARRAELLCASVARLAPRSAGAWAPALRAHAWRGCRLRGRSRPGGTFRRVRAGAERCRPPARFWGHPADAGTAVSKYTVWWKVAGLLATRIRDSVTLFLSHRS